jgi:hypothetical protein
VWHALQSVVKVPGKARLQLSGGGGPGGTIPEPPAPVVVVVPLPVLVPVPGPDVTPVPSPPPAPVGVAPCVGVGVSVPSEHALAIVKSEEKEIANPQWRRVTCSMQPSMRVFLRGPRELSPIMTASIGEKPGEKHDFLALRSNRSHCDRTDRMRWRVDLVHDVSTSQRVGNGSC